jgi:hypothetical protein
MPKGTGLIRTTRSALLVALAAAASACQDEITTAVDGSLIPVEAVTVEVTLPFEDFGGAPQAWGGYGGTYELPRDVVAKDYGGVLNSRVVASYAPYPDSIYIPDSTGTFVPDTTLAFVGGRVVARFDTRTSLSDGPVTLALGTISEEWDYRTTSWDFAVDSVGEQYPWPEPGAGPSDLLATSVWDPEAGDSAVFLLDSVGVSFLADSLAARKGLRLEALTAGVRLDLNGLSYALSARPSVNPDTLVQVNALARGRTFIFDPELAAPDDEMRIGGVPAWRSVFEVSLPDTLYGPPELCAQVQCPLALKPGSLVSASLVLTTAAVPPAFQPQDVLFLDVRPVLEPSRLPKSPLGTTLVLNPGVALSPEFFGEEAGASVVIPLGPYIQAQIGGGEAADATSTLALLSALEPLSLYFAAFEGPSSASPPELRLILTLSDDVGIR